MLIRGGKMQKNVILRIFGAVICIAMTALNLSSPMQSLLSLDSVVYCDSANEKSEIIDSFTSNIISATNRSVDAALSGDESLSDNDSVTMSLFGVFPIRTVTFTQKEDITLLPCGHCVGISIELDGLFVVGTSEVVTDAGGTEVKSPAYMAGITAGDYIIAANGEKITDSAELEEICNAAGGEVVLTVSRGGSEREVPVSAVLDMRTHTYKLGMWVREDTAGIGTLSYYDPEKNTFAALGHPVTDIDTRDTFEIREGMLSPCTVVDIVKGESGKPGEISGAVSSLDKKYGRVRQNTEFGIYGDISDLGALSFLYPNGLTLAYPDEVKTGDAKILCSLDGKRVYEYDCKIVKNTKQSSPAVKGLVIEITDSELIEKTGGIVQGMSGSPIIQGDKLVGVVTHVMINNPERGYGIYAYWMYICG